MHKQAYLQRHKATYKFIDMSQLKDRIKQARKHAGLTQAELAVAIRVSQPVISQLERGENLQSVHLLKIATECGVNPIWLAEGTGEMQELGPVPMVEELETELPMAMGAGKVRTPLDVVQEMLATKAGKALKPDAQQRLLDAAQDSVKEPKSDYGNVITGDFSRSTVVKGNTIVIAQYDVRAAMGAGQVPADYREFVRNLVVDKVQLDDLGLKYTAATNLKIITGWGQSMRGTIADNSPLIVDIGVTDFVEEGVYVFTWLQHLYLKRVQVLDAEHFQLVSDNKEFEPQKARMEDMHFHAKVLGAWNFRKL